MLLLHLCLSVFMCGLIWLVQLVHYPSFHFISKEDFVFFEFFHTKWISFIVMPTMIAEALIQLYLVWKIPSPTHMISTVCLFFIWLTTFIVSVPAHQKLALGKDEVVINRLIKTNWIRTFFWSARVVALFSILV